MDAQFDQFESETAVLRKKVQIKDALKRLTNNPDWDLVINQEFKEKFVSEIMLALASGLVTNKKQKQRYIAYAMAPGFLMQFCDAVISEGESAEQSLREEKETLQ